MSTSSYSQFLNQLLDPAEGTKYAVMLEVIRNGALIFVTCYILISYVIKKLKK